MAALLLTRILLNFLGTRASPASGLGGVHPEGLLLSRDDLGPSTGLVGGLGLVSGER